MRKLTLWSAELHEEFADEDQMRWCFKGGKSAPPPPPPPPPEPEPDRSRLDPNRHEAVSEARKSRISLRKRTGRSGLRTDLGSGGSGISTQG